MGKPIIAPNGLVDSRDFELLSAKAKPLLRSGSSTSASSLGPSCFYHRRREKQQTAALEHHLRLRGNPLEVSSYASLQRNWTLDSSRLILAEEGRLIRLLDT